MNAPHFRPELVERNSKAHDLIAQAYDYKHDEIYNEIEQARLEQTLDDLVRRVGASWPRVLDFGAGTGNLTIKFLERECHVTALDVSAGSLAVLKQKAPNLSGLELCVHNSRELPFDDASFDIAATYSVLHHVPDYLGALREILRVVRPGGLIYIDHELNEQAWACLPALREYRRLAHLTLRAHIWKLAMTGELATYDFWRSAFIKLFFNPRYEREGDLHVWPDDHVEWSEIFRLFAEHSATIVRNEDYLLYRPRAGRAAFEHYRNRCSDTKFVFARR